MSGYIIELYKNIISDEKYWVGQSISNTELKNKVYIVYGEYDKMTVSRTNAFSRMRDVSEMSRDWIGERQKILLFELADHNQLEYRESEDSCGFFSNNGMKSLPCTKLFLGITIFQFNESPKENLKSIKETLCLCRRNILNLVENEGASVECSVLGLLGTYGVAVIWAADQYTDILKMINRIKGADVLSEEPKASPAYQFISVFTFFVQNKDGYNAEKISQLKGTAFLQITLQTNLSNSMLRKIKKAIPKSQNFHMAGEFDLVLEAPACSLYDCFMKGALFDPSDPFYKHHILQTNVRLCESASPGYLKGIRNGKPREPSKTDQDIAKSRLHVSEIETEYRKLREMYFEKFPKTAGMVDSLDLMYGDYHSKIASVSNKMWAADYSLQFLAILQLLQKSLAMTDDEYNGITTVTLLNDIQDILNCFEHQTIHIAESNNLLLDTPKCHLRYMGQNNLVLYAYFGIIKELIKLAYRMQEESRQSKMIPLISVDTVPMISSLLFMDYTTVPDDRLIKFTFPMAAMYALPVYAPYLYHEVFHYVAPRDRVVRNWAKGCILAFCAMKNVVCELMRTVNNYQEDALPEKITERILNSRIYLAVVDKYEDKLADKVRNASGTKFKRSKIDEESIPWLQYERCLIELLTKYIDECNGTVLDENLLYLVLRRLYDEREDIMKECQEMPDQGDQVPSGEKKRAVVFMDHFFDDLSGMFQNIETKKAVKVFQNILQSTGLSGEELIAKEELVLLSDAIKEAVCDLPMIELSGMDAVTYLLTYVKVQNDLLKQVEQDNAELQIQHYIRIGIALDCFFNWDANGKEKLDNLEALQSAFIESYVGLYFSEKKSGEANRFCVHIREIESNAQNWFAKIRDWYGMYLMRYRIFGSLLHVVVRQSSIKERLGDAKLEWIKKFECLKTTKYHESVRMYGIEIRQAVNNTDLTEEQKKAETMKAQERFQKEVFSYNIDIILTYQKQENFEELGAICDKCFQGDKIYQYIDEFHKKNAAVCVSTPIIVDTKKNGIVFWKYTAQDMNGLFQAIRETAGQLEIYGIKQYGDKGDALWYRGHQDSDYILLPSAMRKYAQRAESAQSLRDYQISAYGEFKFRMDDAAEKIDKAGYTECDYLALMQHHGAPTIYMDWTEDAISALYFALEAFIDPGKKSSQNSKDAVLYILHPNLYNEARNKMMDKVNVTSGRTLDYWMKKSILRSTRGLPNLSLQCHSENLGMFLLGDEVDEKGLYGASDERIENLSYCKNQENILYLPLAIYASRANKRVQAQSGMFMAYNIFTNPSEKIYFDYMALENIQKFYLKTFQGAKPFLYAITIKGDAKEEIAGWLKTIGLSKDRIYPELMNIGERIG